MKTINALIFGAILAVLPAVAWSAPGDPGTGIATTDHDFYAGPFLANTTIGECTFCHTPHKAYQTLLLWNHTLSSATFKWDVPSTTAGTTYPTILGGTYKGPTAKCLSCHDGSVAVGDVAWFNETGPTVVDATKITMTSHLIGSGGDMAGNHPVAMPYPYNNVANTYNGSTTGAAAQLAEWQADPTTLNIRMYNDDGLGNITAGVVAAKTGIECSSCHDPHNKASTGDFFLRGTLNGNTTDYICLKCHIK